VKKHGLLFLLLLSFLSKAQTTTNTWAVKISSNVEIRTWKLTYKSEKTEKSLGGAKIVLTKNGSSVSETVSNGSGDFQVMVPGNGVFILTVSYPGCNPKKFEIITTGVPVELQNNNFYPSFSIGGFVMAKPFPGIDYSGLQEPLVKVVYAPKIKNFDDDADYTDHGLDIVSKISNAEQILIDKFCGTNKKGDDALAIPDCPLAKRLYNEAIALIPGEPYPVEQLAKVPDCDKIEEEKKKAEEEKKKAAEEKTAADKAAKDKALADKAEADRAAKEKAAAEKEARSKAATDKVAADKLAKEQKAKEKEAAKTNTVVAKQKPEKKPEKKPAERTDETTKNKMPGSEKEIKKHEYETKNEDGEPVIGHGDSKYSKKQVLGANEYKDALAKAETYFKMKRWAEAKTAYENVLKIKAGDPYASGKLAEVNKMLTK
jgi:hypothetical protein